MKYDPIMCMMVDDSVKSNDELSLAQKKNAVKKTGSHDEKSKDSKTIDHAIRSCDISMYERNYQEAKAAVGGKYGIISNLSDLETAINDANRRGEKEDAKKLKAIYKKYN